VEGSAGGDRFHPGRRDFMRCFHQEKFARFIAPAGRARLSRPARAE